MANMKINGSLEFNTIVGNGLSAILSKIYPIGSIYMSIESASPASFLGGTWEKIKDKFLLSSGDTYTNGDTGGEATHTLTVEEMPSHSHTTVEFTTPSGQMNASSGTVAWWTGGIGSGTGTTGGSQPHNNMPPYLVVYMWKRIA